MAKALAVLGSTGSIGTQALDVCKRIGVQVCGLSARSSIDLLERQIRDFRPSVVCVTDEKPALELKRRVGGLCEIISGEGGLAEIASMPEAGIVLNALVGAFGLGPSMSAIEAGKTLALANKETLVAGGELVMRRAKEKNISVLPVDSEHSAIFQCLEGSAGNKLKSIFLTASGGPFRGKPIGEFKNISVKDALKHPNWSMGQKITIDSATMMNKGLEAIEAMRLFDIRADQVNVLVHPQSVIHSMVEYEDGAVIAQLGPPDMRLPIQYALTYPARDPSGYYRFDPLAYPAMTFEPPDCEKFPCLPLAFEAAAQGGLMPAVMNGANEESVYAFLDGKATFMEIPKLIECAMGAYNYNRAEYTAADAIEAGKWARSRVRGCLKG